MITLLVSIASAHAPQAAPWLAEQIAKPELFAPAFAGAARRLGRAPIRAEDAAKITAAGLRWPVCGVDECGCAALLLAVARARPADHHVELVRHLIRHGELRERQAVLRVLAAMPEPARFVELAIDACRTNVQGVFEAIACDNDFPARHFPDPAWHQMVLKALFIGAPLARVAGVAGRTTPELLRMVDAFASERRAAGRPVPADVALVRRDP